MFPVLIKSINQAFDEIKSFGGGEGEDDYRTATRQALKGILEAKMNKAVDVHLEQRRGEDIPDWCHGSYSRHLLPELGDLELSFPRSRTLSSRVILRKFARRACPGERLIMLVFIFGLSNRKVGQALLTILGEKVSPPPVSWIA